VEGPPVRTTFRLPIDSVYNPETGTYDPFSTEPLAPFHQDAAQRFVLVDTQYGCYAILPVKALLDLHESRRGSEVEWDEWKSCVFVGPSFDRSEPLIPRTIRVSGSRVFCLYSSTSGQEAYMRVYDLSAQGRVKWLTERVHAELGGLRYLSSTGAQVQLPWGPREIHEIEGVSGNIIFVHVSVAVFLGFYGIVWLNVFCWVRVRFSLPFTLRGRSNTRCTSGRFGDPVKKWKDTFCIFFHSVCRGRVFLLREVRTYVP
jgi:hypothetical protein